MLGFENEADATRAAALIKKAAAPVRKEVVPTLEVFAYKVNQPGSEKPL